MFGGIVRAVTGASKLAQSTQTNPLGSLIPTIAGIAGNKLDQFFGLDRAPEQPSAVSVPDQQPNKQDTIETDMSGSMGISSPTSDYQQAVINRMMGQTTQANTSLLPVVREVGTRIVPFVRKNLPAITGIGGAGAMLSDIFTEQGLCSPNTGGKPYSISKVTGCISVTRKQQRMLKELVMTVGIDNASASLGLSQEQIGLLIVKKFPQRSRGISGASMKTTRRTIRQLTRYAHDLDEFCKRPTPTRRRRTK